MNKRLETNTISQTVKTVFKQSFKKQYMENQQNRRNTHPQKVIVNITFKNR